MVLFLMMDEPLLVVGTQKMIVSGDNDNPLHLLVVGRENETKKNGRRIFSLRRCFSVSEGGPCQNNSRAKTLTGRVLLCKWHLSQAIYETTKQNHSEQPNPPLHISHDKESSSCHIPLFTDHHCWYHLWILCV